MIIRNKKTALINVPVANKMEIQMSARQVAEQNAEHEDRMRTKERLNSRQFDEL